MNKVDLFKKLAIYLRVSVSVIERIHRSAPHRYRHYQIKKRSGGLRDIYHPTPELKAIQRWLVANVFNVMPVSENASAYEVGSKIRINANAHLYSNYFLKLDFTDFFPSIKSDWIIEYLSNPLFELAPDAVLAITQFISRVDSKNELALSIGAPSSPAISNRIMYDLDCELNKISINNMVAYTRYADDLVFSTKVRDILPAFEIKVRDVISSITPRLQVNEQKTLHLSRKRLVKITGLVITPQRKISVGREIKRKVKTQIYLLSNGNLPKSDISHLRGLVSYINDVEATFIDSLRIKYGEKIINDLIKGQDNF